MRKSFIHGPGSHIHEYDTSKFPNQGGGSSDGIALNVAADSYADKKVYREGQGCTFLFALVEVEAVGLGQVQGGFTDKGEVGFQIVIDKHFYLKQCLASVGTLLGCGGCKGKHAQYQHQYAFFHLIFSLVFVIGMIFGKPVTGNTAVSVPGGIPPGFSPKTG
jgi:hypothetical protein